MQVIERKRNSGKTTMLLHYMELVSNSIMVKRTEEDAKQVFRLSKLLGLHIHKNRFIGMTHIDDKYRDGQIILIDDADCIMKMHSKQGYNLIKHADIITITKGEN